jgi:predicted acyltransferase
VTNIDAKQISRTDYEPVKRIDFIDAIRGLAIAAMIIVNNQGDWSNVFPILKHSAWHGLSGADLVFPLFIFIMGLSSAMDPMMNQFSYNSIKKILKRSSILIIFGLVINIFAAENIDNFRIPGVLQRIGLCYAILSILAFRPNPKRYVFLLILITSAYSAMLLFLPYVNGGPTLASDSNICYYIDSNIFFGHTYAHAPAKGFDPEGLPSTMGALTTALIGSILGYIIKKAYQNYTDAGFGTHSDNAKLPTINIFMTAVIFMTVGLILSFIIPINKNLWTTSFSFICSSIAVFLAIITYILCRHEFFRRLFYPLRIMGKHSLAVYFASSMAGLATIKITINDDGKKAALKAALIKSIIPSGLDPMLSSLLYSLIHLIIWMLFAITHDAFLSYFKTAIRPGLRNKSCTTPIQHQ